MSPQAIVLFGLATAGLALTPGPNVLVIVARSASQGRAAGMLVVAGVELGFLVHLSAAATGLTMLLLALPAVYSVLRVAGAAYLIVVAWQVAFGRSEIRSTGGGRPRLSSCGLVRSGFLSNALNPKTAAFYLAAFPQFLAAHGDGNVARILALGSMHIGISTTCNSLYVVGASRLPALLADRGSLRRFGRFAVATALASFATALALGPAPASR